MSDICHKLKSLGLFQSLSDRELKEVSSHFKVFHAKNRTQLFEENMPIDNLYLMLYGSVKIQRNDVAGTPVILNFMGRGEFLGVAMVDLFSPLYPATAIAIEDCGFLCFSRKFFREHLVNIPEIKDTVTRQVGERFMEFQNDRCMERAQIPQRLADFLLRLSERQPQNSGHQILFPITRKDMALRLGTHTETIIRILSTWSKAGVIKTKDRRIEILDELYLREIRYMRPPEKPSKSVVKEHEKVAQF